MKSTKMMLHSIDYRGSVVDVKFGIEFHSVRIFWKLLFFIFVIFYVLTASVLDKEPYSAQENSESCNEYLVYEKLICKRFLAISQCKQAHDNKEVTVAAPCYFCLVFNSGS